MTNYYLTTHELRTYLGQDDAIDLPLLDMTLLAAEQWVNNYCNRRFYLDAAASARVYFPLNSYTVFTDDFAPYLDATPTTITVKTDDDDDGVFETTLPASSYALYPLNRNSSLRPATGIVSVDGTAFPANSRGSVQVTARWGWPEVPQAVKAATAFVAVDLFRGTETRLDEFGPVRIRDNAKTLLAAYRKLVVV